MAIKLLLLHLDIVAVATILEYCLIAAKGVMPPLIQGPQTRTLPVPPYGGHAVTACWWGWWTGVRVILLDLP